MSTEIVSAKPSTKPQASIVRLLEMTGSSIWSSDLAIREVPSEALSRLLTDARREVSVIAGSDHAGKAMKLIMAAYRTPDLVDPQAFIRLAVQAVEDFPGIVVSRLASPKTGIVRDSKFPPSIAEIVSWCERDAKAMERAVGSAADELHRRDRAAEAAAEAMRQAERKAAEQREAKAKKAAEEAYWNSPEGKAEQARLDALGETAREKIRQAAIQRAREEAKAKREREARAAWTRAFMSAVKDDPARTEAAFALLENEAVAGEATKAELAGPGGGVQFLLQRLAAF